jgi:hypothetical protein
LPHSSGCRGPRLPAAGRLVLGAEGVRVGVVAVDHRQPVTARGFEARPRKRRSRRGHHREGVPQF